MANIKWTDQVAERVLNALAEHGQHTLAARAAGVSSESVRARRVPNSRYYDSVFAARYEEARELFCDRLEAEAVRRAVGGDAERVIVDSRGRVVGEVRRYSDKLLSLLIQRHRREFHPRCEWQAVANVEQILTRAEVESLIEALDEVGLDALELVMRQYRGPASIPLGDCEPPARCTAVART